MFLFSKVNGYQMPICDNGLIFSLPFCCRIGLCCWCFDEIFLLKYFSHYFTFLQ